MWISQKKYAELCRTAKENEHDADMFRSLLNRWSHNNSIVLHDQFILMDRELYDKFTNEVWLAEEKIKNISAELEWYKVKYHEMKMQNNNEK